MLTNAEKLLSKDVSKNKITAADASAAKSRLSATSSMQDLSKCDFIIEAVSESPQLKAKIFNDLAKITQKGTVLATNTSSISITAIARAAKEYDRMQDVIGMHFMK